MKLSPAQEVAALKARIARKREQHQSTAADERDLVRAVAKLLKSEIRARRKAA